MNLCPNQKSAVRVCSLKVNPSNAATHAAMHHILSQKDPPFDIILIQEPWWQEIDSSYTTVSLAGWQVTLPKTTIAQNECVRACLRLGMCYVLVLMEL